MRDAFGYYVYLYFADPGDLGSASRQVATHSFLQMFENANLEDLRKLKVRPAQMAVFLAPVVGAKRPAKSSTSFTSAESALPPKNCR